MTAACGTSAQEFFIVEDAIRKNNYPAGKNYFPGYLPKYLPKSSQFACFISKPGFFGVLRLLARKSEHEA